MSPTIVYGCKRNFISSSAMSNCFFGPASKLSLREMPSEFFAEPSKTILHLVEIRSILNTP